MKDKDVNSNKDSENDGYFSRLKLFPTMYTWKIKLIKDLEDVRLIKGFVCPIFHVET